MTCYPGKVAILRGSRDGKGHSRAGRVFLIPGKGFQDYLEDSFLLTDMVELQIQLDTAHKEAAG